MVNLEKTSRLNDCSPCTHKLLIGVFFGFRRRKLSHSSVFAFQVALQNPRSDSFLIGENRRESVLCFMECGREQGQPYRVKNEERRAEVADAI